MCDLLRCVTAGEVVAGPAIPAIPPATIDNFEDVFTAFPFKE